LTLEDLDLASTGVGVDHTTTYTYDNNGSTASRAVDSVTDASYAWDLRNRLVGYDADGNGSSSAGDITYTFDHEGNRVTKNVGELSALEAATKPAPPTTRAN
jgi:hypothetical protein